MKERTTHIDGLKIQGKRRDNSLDIVRGLAVMLMIIAHSIFFFHNGSNPALNFFKDLGDTVAFVTFLIVSGATTYYVYQKKKDDWASSKSESFKRILFLIGGYYVVAVVSAFHTFDFSSPQWITQVIEILTFINTPGFTEFLVNFIVYSSLFILFPEFFDYVGKNLKASLLIGLAAYVLGVLIYPIEIAKPFLEYKMLLSGHADVYRFPLLQYFIVFLLGFNFGELLKASANSLDKRKKLFKASLPFILIIAVVFFLQKLGSTLNIPHITDFERWPPSIPFLSLGILFSIAAFFVVIKNSNKDKIPYIYTFLISIGVNAYYYFIFHLIILQVYDKILGQKTDSVILYLILTFILFVLTANFVKRFTKSRVKPELTNPRHEDVYPKKNTKATHISIMLVLLYTGIFSAGINVDSSISTFAGYRKREGDVKGVVFSKKEIEIKWWNYDYQYSKKLTIINDGLYSTIPTGTVVEFSIDYEGLREQNKILSDLSDLRLVHQNGSEYQEIAYLAKVVDKTAYIRFKTLSEIAPSERDGDFYIYYGNRAAAKPTPDVTLSNSNIDLGRISQSNEKISALSISIDKIWTLIGESSGDKLGMNLEINQNPFPQNQNVDYTYEVVGTDVRGKLFRTPNEGYSVDIDVNQFQPGIYQVQAIAESNGTKVLSSKESFLVSYPLYITWSMDWEGYDVKDQFLDDIDEIANKYSIPVSHFFNPRIYIASNIPSDRASSLTDWVKQRAESRGDSIDMHFHMFEDMVRAAGVDPVNMKDDEGEEVKRPQWGSVQQSGYDVLMTSYTRDELNKILGWGLNKFEENNLPKPLGFRAGGWFADLDNLQSIQDSGFAFDSSGREEFKWGSQKISGPWQLQGTTQPFRPSTTNQNSTNPAPNFNIWEIPNNGTDSYTFTANDMKYRFDLNFGNGVLREKRVVTYLSHPHWFNIDKGKLDELFTYISRYDFSKDQGPVVFTNIHEVYNAWAQ